MQDRCSYYKVIGWRHIIGRGAALLGYYLGYYCCGFKRMQDVQDGCSSDCACFINASISSLMRFIAGILCSFIVYVLYCRKAAAGTAAAMRFYGKAAPGAACQAPGAYGGVVLLI